MSGKKESGIDAEVYKINNDSKDLIGEKLFGYGVYERSLDDKGRIAIPHPLVHGIDRKLTGTAWLEHCILICNISNWEAVLTRLVQREVQDFSSPDVAKLFTERSFTGIREEQNRIIIPSSFRSYANITREIIIVGLGNRLELWDKTSWLDCRQKLGDQAREILPALPVFAQEV